MTEKETFERLSLLSRELSSGCICNFPASDSELFNDLSLHLLRPIAQRWIIAETDDRELRNIPRVSDTDLSQSSSSSSETQLNDHCRIEIPLRDSLLVHLSTLAMFWDASHPQCYGISSSPSGCGRIATLRSRLLSSDMLQTLIFLLYSSDQFVRAVAVRCISRICLDAPQEWKEVVQNFIDTILNSDAVEMCVCILDVLIIILKHSHISVHPHHQELAATASSCNNIRPAKSVTCETVQKEIVSYLQTSWDLLINVFLLKHLKNVSDTDRPQYLHLENSELVSEGNENTASNSVSISKDKPTVNLPVVPNGNLTVMISFLRLWKLLLDKQEKEEESSVNCEFFSEKNIPCIIHCIHNLPVFPSTVASVFLDIILRFVITPEFNSYFISTTVIALAAENWLKMLFINTSEPRGFGGPKLLRQDRDASERISPVFRKTSLLILKCLQNSYKTSNNSISANYDVVSKFLEYVSSICGSEPWLIKLFGEHDDDLSDCLLSCLDLYLCIQKHSCSHSTTAISDCLSCLNPHVLWKDFVKNIAYDHQVILDILTSGDSSFLEYFIRYLKLLAADLSCAKETMSEKETSLSQLMQYSSDDDDEDIDGDDDDSDSSLNESSSSDSRTSITLMDTLPLLMAVQSSIKRLHEKELFPFNPTPLLRLLTQCCESY